MMNHLRVGILFLALCAAPLALGCGGGGGGPVADTTRGVAEFSIKWPDIVTKSSRVIPVATCSISITLTSPTGGQSGSRLIPRPPPGTNTTNVRFDSLAPGVLTVKVTAFPNADGTGTVQATGQADIAIIGGSTVSVNIDPLSTVDRIRVTPNNHFTIPGIATQFQATPLDKAGAIILVSPMSLVWSSDKPTIATVDSSGNVRAVALGVANIKVVDSESGKTAAVPINVVDPVVISPKAITLTLGDIITFTVDVTGLSSPEVVWSVVEQGGGAIDGSGRYVAPQIAGTYHVRVTSSVDSTRFDTATVTVEKGSGTVIIQ